MVPNPPNHDDPSILPVRSLTGSAGSVRHRTPDTGHQAWRSSPRSPKEPRSGDGSGGTPEDDTNGQGASKRSQGFCGTYLFVLVSLYMDMWRT